MSALGPTAEIAPSLYDVCCCPGSRSAAFARRGSRRSRFLNLTAPTSLFASIDVNKGAHFWRGHTLMTIRIAAIEVSHWHAVYDAAYLRHLIAMPDVELVAIQDSDADLAVKRAAEVGSPPTCTHYVKMLERSRRDFVVALGRHRQMAG